MGRLVEVEVRNANERMRYVGSNTGSSDHFSHFKASWMDFTS